MAKNDPRPIETDRTKAIEWWNNLRLTERVVQMNKFGIEPYRSSNSLTGREIEEIWKKEILKEN